MSRKPPEPEIRRPLTRRQMLERIALALTATGVAPFELAWGKHVHRAAREEKEKTGAYQPKLFKSHEYQTVGRLAELIIPADEHSGSAVDAGAPEFIDLLCSQNPELADIYTGGLLWLEAQMRQEHGASFLEATEEQQTSLLDRLVEEGDPQKTEAVRATCRYGASEQYQGFSYLPRPSCLGSCTGSSVLRMVAQNDRRRFLHQSRHRHSGCGLPGKSSRQSIRSA